MSTFAEDIEEAAGGEQIEAVIIGPMGWGGDFHSDDRHKHALANQRHILTWGVARTLLDYEYDAGFGAPDCNAVNAWTASRVIFVSQYDGSTTVEWVPRNPADGPVEMPGG